MTMVEAGAASRFDPMLIEHCLELAKEFLEETKPVIEIVPTIVVPSSERAWYVLQTVVHGEDAVVDELCELGFESYAPMMKKEVIHKRTRRPVTRIFRLFNRYLFARLPTNTKAWQTVRSIEELDCVLGANGIPCPIPESDIARFKMAEAARQFDVTKAATFPVGSRVRVLSGPFGGFSGLVESLPGKGVVKAMLEIFARATPVDFPFDMIEPE